MRIREFIGRVTGKQRIEALETERRELIEERARLIHDLTSAQSAVQLIGKELTNMQEEMAKRVRAQIEQAAETEALKELIKHTLTIADDAGTHVACTHLSVEFRARREDYRTAACASVPEQVRCAVAQR